MSPKIIAQIISVGDSMSLIELGVIDYISSRKNIREMERIDLNEKITSYMYSIR
jgi:hypothetical protein